MSKLRPVDAEKVVKALACIGFEPVRQHGSHLVMKHPDGRMTVIPMHRGEMLGRGILRKIARDAPMGKGCWSFLRMHKSLRPAVILSPSRNPHHPHHIPMPQLSSFTASSSGLFASLIGSSIECKLISSSISGMFVS